MPRWKLAISTDTGRDGKPEVVEVILDEGQRCIVGRGKTAHIRCDTGRCSREHLAFDVVDGEVWVEDLGSSNGSWLNGQRIARARVQVGDKIHAGGPRLSIVSVALEPPATEQP